MSKITIDDVRQVVEKAGWHLLSTDYVNLKTDLKLQCPEGHDCFISFEKFRRGAECPICKSNVYFHPEEVAPKKNGHRILAFDQASITSGWAAIDNDTLISYGHHTSQGTHSTERIAKTRYWVAAMIDKWKPDEIVIEDIQLQKFKYNGNEGDAVIVFKKLAHLQGALKNYFYEIKIPYKVVPPATWRNYSHVKGRERADQKRSAQLLVKKFYDVSVSQDEADAILIARWAAHDHRNSEIIEF